MTTTMVPWATDNWHVVRGCSKAGEGCRRCWACRLAATRLKHRPEYAGLAERTGPGEYCWTGSPRFFPEELTKPLRWRRPRRAFVAPFGDLFHNEVDYLDIIDVFAIMSLAPAHTFIVPTKRIGRAQQLLSSPNFIFRVGFRRQAIASESGIAAGDKVSWPLPNVWICPSAWDQDSVDLAVTLVLETPASVRGLMLEPMLGLHALEVFSSCRAGETAFYWKHADWYRAGVLSLPKPLTGPRFYDLAEMVETREYPEVV